MKPHVFDGVLYFLYVGGQTMRQMKEDDESKNVMKRSFIVLGLMGVFVLFLFYLLFELRPEMSETLVAKNESKGPEGAPASLTDKGDLGETDPVQSSEPPPGEIKISEQEPKPEKSLSPDPKPPVVASSGAPSSSKEEDFTFFKTLKEKETTAELEPSKKKDTTLPVLQEKPKEIQQPGKGKHYTIQVAALNVERSAIALADKLKQDGFFAYVVTVHRPEKGTIHRVRVGRFLSIHEAKKVAQQIRDKRKLNFFITLTEG